MQKSITSKLAQILNSIEPMLIELEQEATSAKPELEQIIANKCFTPNQDERIKVWFVKFLTLRESLWQVIDEAHEFAGIRIREIKTDNEYRLFVLGFVAACLVVKLDRLLLEKVAAHTFIQRKLNEGIPERNVQRKQYTAIYEAFTDVKNAYKIYQAIKFVDNQQIKLNTFKNDRDIGNFVRQLNEYRSYLDENKRNYLKRFIQFVKHIFKRRGASVKQQAQFKLLEVSGRILSECVNKENKLVTNEILEQVQQIVKPGDIFVTRHQYALTNLFLPGFWPHSAIYIGTEAEREEIGINIPKPLLVKWQGDICTFEALKDGVLLRTLENTLSVDGFVILRPTISQKGINKAIERILDHEGKKYNFDFDFFRSDRLVCTELSYRAFDEIEHIKIQLKERAGRPTLSAEDLCDLAIETKMFNAIAIFGVNNMTRIITDQQDVKKLLIASYK
ncbi:MAG: YiiX/YebB-like N1pC/P60 family cysteine hydrolase [Pseudomonadota bacterium]